jgi:hypothetical protein
MRHQEPLRTAMHPPSPPTHPVEPDSHPGEADAPSPNPSQLPVEPEFGQALPLAEPEDPGVSKPQI